MNTTLSVEVLNPQGNPISLPTWVVKRLDSIKLLFWNRAEHRHQISGRIFAMMDLWDGPDFRHRDFQAFNPQFANSRSPDSGYRSAFLSAIGKNCEGLNCDSGKTRMLENEADRTSLPNLYDRPGLTMYEGNEASRIVREVKARRRQEV